jgi:putative inorganic carbon (hco3(-)) transporter
VTSEQLAALQSPTEGARVSSRVRRPSVLLIVLLVVVGISAALGAVGGGNPALGIAAIGAVLLALTMAIRPDATALVVVGVLYSNAAVIAVQFHGVPFIAAAGVPFLLVVPVGYELIVRRKPVVITSAFPLIVLFLLIQVLGALFADDVASSSSDVATFLVEGIGLYFMLTNTVRSLDTLRRVVWVLLAVGVFLGLLSFYQDATKSYSNDYWGFAQMSEATLNTGTSTLTGANLQPRLAGSVGETNRYAQIMLMLVPLGLFWAASARSRIPRLAAFAAAGAASLGVALTFSRGAAVGFFLVLAIMFILGYIKPIQVFVVALGIALLLAVVPQYASRVGSLVDLTGAISGDSAGGSPDGSVLSRATEALTAVLVFADHPILGVGPGRFPSYYRLYADDVGIRVKQRDREAHDLYLHILAENGILGFIVFMGILGITLRDLIRVRRRWLTSRPEIAAMATGLMLSIVTYMTTGLFLHLSYARYFWLMLALAGAAAHIGLELTESARQRVAVPSSGPAPIPSIRPVAQRA